MGGSTKALPFSLKGEIMSRIEKLLVVIAVLLGINILFLTYLIAYESDNVEATAHLTQTVQSSISNSVKSVFTDTDDGLDNSDDLGYNDDAIVITNQAIACYMDVVDNDGYIQLGMLLQGDTVVPTGRELGSWVQITLIDTNIGQNRNCWYQP